MPSSCPICEQPIASTAAHCSVCGFPTALAIEGLRSLGGPDGPPAAVGSASSAVSTGGLRPKAPTPAPSPEEELNTAISRDLRARMQFARELGQGPDLTSELCHAALSEAEGRSAEALDILRSAQSRYETETDEVLQHRLATLRERQDLLEKTGVRFALDTDLDRIGDAKRSEDQGAAIALLLQAERRVGQLESDWKGLQGLLAQIDSLRNEALELGIPLGEISGELDAIHDRLRTTEVTEEALDSFAQEAAQVLMLLHEAIPAGLAQELTRHEEALSRFPEDHAPSAGARRLALDVSRHLTKGRLSEAVQSVRDLRQAIAELERAPEPPRGEPSASRESDDEALDRLLKKARSLAGRIRTLAPDSEAARDAAVQIREATELLRDRQLEEADLTLTRLMRMLASEAPRT